MSNNGADKDRDEPKVLKVNVPAKYHHTLHSLKILKGRTVSDMVSEALELYFDEVQADVDVEDVTDEPTQKAKD